MPVIYFAVIAKISVYLCLFLLRSVSSFCDRVKQGASKSGPCKLFCLAVRLCMIMVLSACLLLLLYGSSFSRAQSNCQVPKELAGMCEGLITYPVDGDDNSLKSFDTAARLYVQDNSFVQILPAECASSWKKFICALSFVKCEVVNDTIEQRLPCQSLCYSLREGPCDGLLPDSYDETLLEYCGSLNETGCNAMENVNAAVESPTVVYKTSTEGVSGICEGFVQEFHRAVNSTGDIRMLPPLSPPGTAQVAFDNLASTLIDLVPRYLPSGCQTAIRRFACLSIFYGVSNASVEDGGQDFPFPRFPCSSICQDLETSCPLDDETLSSLLPGGFPDGLDLCKNVTSLQIGTAFGDLPLYPVAVQEIFVKPFNVSVETQCQNDWPDETFNVSVVCPGRLVPYARGSRATFKLPFSECALPCPGVTFLEEEEKRFFGFLFGFSLASTVCGILYLAVSFSDPQIMKKINTHNLIPLLFCLQSVLIAVCLMISLIPFLDDPFGLFCVSDVVLKEQRDGGWCLFQAVLLAYTPNVAGCWWLCLAYDLYQRVVAQDNTSQNILKYHLFSWLMPLAGPFTLIAGLRKAGKESNAMTFGYILCSCLGLVH